MTNAENTQKPEQSGFRPAITAANAALEWIAQGPGNIKVAKALRILLQLTRDALLQGVEPEPRAAEDIMTIYFDEAGGVRPQTDPSKWLSGKEALNWWGRYQHAIDVACRLNGCPMSPRLQVVPGGGRGNNTTFEFRFLPISAEDEVSGEPASGADAVPAGQVRYRMDPVKPIWWFRWLFGSKPFPMRSWRGYALIGLLGIELLLVVALWSLVLLVLSRPRPVLASDLMLILVAFGFTALMWKSSRALRALTWSRVSIASEFHLAMSELHGQFRTTRLTDGKIGTRHFQVVRHWAICPWCEGEVDLAEGGKAFPDRIVGRCGDSPAEHVFSFDPLTLCGEALITPAVATNPHASVALEAGPSQSDPENRAISSTPSPQ